MQRDCDERVFGAAVGKDGVKVKMGKKNTDFCIICGKAFDSSNTVRSLEHIIPEALENKKLTTCNVCKICNNALGAFVDSYLTNYILVKMARRAKLDKDKDLQVFDSCLTDDKGRKYRITNDGPEIFLRISMSEDKQSLHMEVPNTTEGKGKARNYLKKHYHMSDFEIDDIFSDSEKVIVSDKQYEQPGTFKQDATLDFARFKLAAIKIAYEYAVEKFGESYMTDGVAVALRSYLLMAKNGNTNFTEAGYKVIKKYCHCKDSLTGIIVQAIKTSVSDRKENQVRHMVFLYSDAENKLFCGMRILDEPFLTFTVMLSEHADIYLDGNFYASVIFTDGYLYELVDGDLLKALKKEGTSMDYCNIDVR